MPSSHDSSIRPRGRAIPLRAVVAAAIAVACAEVGGVNGGAGEENIIRIRVWPQAVTIGTGQVARFLAYGFLSEKDSILVDAAWSASGGIISPRGEFNPGTDTGRYHVTATHPQRLWLADSAAVAVQSVSPLIARLGILPQNPTIPLGATVNFRAFGLSVLDDTIGVAVDWTTTGGALEPLGLGQVEYTATQLGAFWVTAAAATFRESTTVVVGNVPVASVSVNPPSATISTGQTVLLQATPRDANGNPLTGRAITWATSAPGVATVNGAGLVAAQAVGTATITATSEGQSGTASITVSTIPVASVSVSPGSLALTEVQTGQLTATVRDAGGNVLTGRAVIWTSSTPAVATVNGNGLVTPQGGGSTTITATSEGQSGSASVTVTLAAVASVTVSPASATRSIGQTIQFNATPRDASGTPLNRPVTWSSGAPGVATVSATGLATAQGTGTATITATSGGQSGSATLTVGAAPVASVSVSPSSLSLQVGQTGQLTATPLDAGGSPLPGRPVTWSTTNSNVATVNGSGLVTARGSGTATIRATSEGRTGSATVVVSGVPVASVTVAPSVLNLTEAQTGQLTATLRDAAGNVLTGRPIAWVSVPTGVATVNGGGVVTGQGAGVATVTATSEGQSGSAVVTVTLAAVASVTVSPGSFTLGVGETRQLVATPLDAAGTALTGRVITWQTSAAAVATVNGSGLVMAQALGSVVVTATSGGFSGSANGTVTTSTTGPADILGPATFETGWDGWTSSSGGTPGGSVARTTERSFQGSWSAKRSIPSGGDSDAALWHQFSPSRNDVYFRTYVYFNSFPSTSAYKTFAFWTASPGSRQLIIYLESNGVHGWSPQGGSLFDWQGFTVTTGTWHSIEINYQKSQNRVRVWWDGNLVSGGSNGWVTTGGGDGQGIWRFELGGLVNSPSNTSSHYWDGAALSTQRIGQ